MKNKDSTASQVAPVVKNLPANAADIRRDAGSIPGLGRSPGGGNSNPFQDSSPWMEEPGGLPSMGSQRVGHDWSDLARSLACQWEGKSIYVANVQDTQMRIFRQNKMFLHLFLLPGGNPGSIRQIWWASVSEKRGLNIIGNPRFWVSYKHVCNVHIFYNSQPFKIKGSIHA